MDFVAYNEILICDKPLVNVVVAGVTVGYEFQIKYPSYRGCFLSCIEALDLEVDDKKLDNSMVYFGLNGKQFTIGELSELFREYWYVRTPAVIRVMQPGGLEKGEHKVRVSMRHRVPYTGYFGQYLTLDSDRTKKLVCA